MKKYRILFSERAVTDFTEITDYLSMEIKMPSTSEKFAHQLLKTIASLSFSAEIYPVIEYKIPLLSHKESLHRINFKNWAIIYTILGDVVGIERIIHGSLIKKTFN